MHSLNMRKNGSRPSSTITITIKVERSVLNIQGAFLATAKKKTKALGKLCICSLHHLMGMPKTVWLFEKGGSGAEKREYGEKPSEPLNKDTHTKWGQTISLTWMAELDSPLLNDRESLTISFPGIYIYDCIEIWEMGLTQHCFRIRIAIHLSFYNMNIANAYYQMILMNFSSVS